MSRLLQLVAFSFGDNAGDDSEYGYGIGSGSGSSGGDNDGYGDGNGAGSGFSNSYGKGNGYGNGDGSEDGSSFNNLSSSDKANTCEVEKDSLATIITAIIMALIAIGLSKAADFL